MNLKFRIPRTELWFKIISPTYIHKSFKCDKSVWGAQNMGTIRKGLGDREGNPIIEELLSTEQHNGWS